MVDDVQNSVGRSVDVSLNEPRTVYEHLSLQMCHQIGFGNF